MKKLIFILFMLFILTIANLAHDKILVFRNNPHNFNSSIFPEEQQVYYFSLRKNDQAHFSVVGDGSGDIDCWLIDNKQVIVKSDLSVVDGCTIDLTNIKYSQKYKLHIMNNSSNKSNFAFRYYK